MPLLRQSNTRTIALGSSALAGPVYLALAINFARHLYDSWLYIIGALTVALLLSFVAARIGPSAQDIPPGAATIGREAWEGLAYVLAVIVLLIIPTVPLVLAMIYIDRHPEALFRLLPLASLLAGLVFGCAVAWLARKRIKGLADVLEVIGFCSAVIGGIGSGVAYLQSP